VPAFDTASHFLIAVGVVLAASVAGGALAARSRQPRVVGELCAGLVLGPTVLGALAPDMAAWLFPAEVRSMLDGLAQLGLAVFVFGVGQELAGKRMSGVGRQAVLVTQASLVVPLVAGTVLATLLLADVFGIATASRPAFALFVGCALGVTALPVLARMLNDLGLSDTRPGRLSLVAAAIGDGVCWLLLAVVLAIATGGGPLQLLLSASVGVTLTALSVGPVRWLLTRLAERSSEGSEPVAVVLLVVAIVATSAVTAAVGLHHLIGALLVGLAWPTRGAPAALAAPLVCTATRVLLPFFFLGFGLTLDLGALALDASALAAGGILLAVAVGSKVVGPGIVARLTGMSWRESLALGTLLNTRGLTELVLLRIGFEAGVIDARLLRVLTVVALVTTVITGPLLRLTGYRGRASEPVPRAIRPKDPSTNGVRVGRGGAEEPGVTVGDGFGGEVGAVDAVPAEPARGLAGAAPADEIPLAVGVGQHVWFHPPL
jgi:Kef-type K+ transport system membrane component KefB